MASSPPQATCVIFPFPHPCCFSSRLLPAPTQADQYFAEHTTGRSATSTNTLSRLALSRMDATEIMATLKGVPDDFIEAKQRLKARCRRCKRVSRGLLSPHPDAHLALQSQFYPSTPAATAPGCTASLIHGARSCMLALTSSSTALAQKRSDQASRRQHPAVNVSCGSSLSLLCTTTCPGPPHRLCQKPFETHGNCRGQRLLSVNVHQTGMRGVPSVALAWTFSSLH